MTERRRGRAVVPPLGRLQPHKANHRTHRKVLVVDEEVAFTGGVGIADEWQGDARNPSEWRDTHFRLRGPAVDGLRAAFLNNWVEAEDALFDRAVDRFPDQPQPGSAVVQCVRGASSTGWSDVSTLFRTLLGVAEQRVRITTAYFVPDERLNEPAVLGGGPRRQARHPAAGAAHRQALRPARRGGVLRAPARARHRASGATRPPMLHAKVMTVDGVAANIGSANLNARSATLDEEINVVVLEPDLVGVLDAHFDEDLERSERVAPGRWEDRSLPQRALEAGRPAPAARDVSRRARALDAGQWCRPSIARVPCHCSQT